MFPNFIMGHLQVSPLDFFNWMKNFAVPGEVKNVKPEKTSPFSCILKWDRVHGAESYIVKWKGSQNEEETTTKTTNVILKDLIEGSIYLFSVAAQNQGGTGIFSDSVDFYTGICKNAIYRPIYPYRRRRYI